MGLAKFSGEPRRPTVGGYRIHSPRGARLRRFFTASRGGTPS
jgi:hypothetical protein